MVSWYVLSRTELGVIVETEVVEKTTGMDVRVCEFGF
jgi:hypothetical protein